ncbi:hypothetical protein [Desulfolutivibrio sp.]|uniref:hypothetical protein n=1 Tax=Desulfolutivibrio sp. TaxID=2773296 RepID=UPI002F967DD9
MREIVPQSAQAGGFTPFHEDMSALLHLMRRTMAESGALPAGGVLAEQVFLGQGYELRLVCRQGGARPILACMEKPVPHQVSLGRLDKDGRVRVFSYGLRLFYDFLAELEVLDRFCLDLERALSLHQWGRALPGADAGGLSRPGGGALH